MPRHGGASSRGASGDMQHKRNQLFSSVKAQKLDTLRWLLVHGGVNVNTRDDEEHTALQLAAVMGKEKSLDVIVSYIKRGGQPSDYDVPDDAGRTPLMMAAAKGHFGCCKLLIDFGAKINLKDESGKTARQYALGRKHENIVKLIDGDIEESEEEAEDVPDEEYMTSTQRSKLKKKELQMKEGRGKIEGGSDDEKAKEDEEEEKKEDVKAPEPKWDEVKKIIADDKKDLTISRQNDTSGESDEIDMAIFYTGINRLQLRMPQGKLTSFPGEIKRLPQMLTLILSFNSLESLPEEIGTLSNLKHFECEGNQLKALPKAMGKLNKLEVLNLTNNKLTSLDGLKGCTNLTSIHVDGNQLTALDVLPFKKMERLNHLSAKGNQIDEVPSSIGALANSLISINLADNKLTELPREMGNLKEKKFQTYDFDGNPFEDPKLRRMLPKGKKDLLNYLKKLKPQKKSSKKKKKKEESDEEDEEDGGPSKPWPLSEKRDDDDDADDDDDDEE